MHRGYRQLTESLAFRYPRVPHFIALTRLNRPIGILLLLWPTLWALWIAAGGFPGWHLLMVFVLGTILTRSAGCVINDFTDRNFDGDVERTRNRPLATGQIKSHEALLFTALLLFPALLLVLSTNLMTVAISVIAAAVAAIYPFMKRFTYLPQVILGLAFSFGIPMAFAAIDESVPRVAWLLMAGNLLWTVAYDTEYAMVDRDDDIRIGLKSTAILFGDMDRLAIGILQISFLGTLVLVARMESLTHWFYYGVVVAAILFGYQQYLIRDQDRGPCFRAFLNNHWVGLSVFCGLWLHYLMPPV